MEMWDIYQRMALAVGIGLLIGLERGFRKREENEGGRWAGLRTFALLGTLGGLMGYVGTITSDLVLVVTSLGVVAYVGGVYFHGLMEEDDKGATTEVAALVTYALGVVAVRGDVVIAAAGAVVMTALLDFKPYLHRLVLKLQEQELDAFIKLLVLSVVVLPFLPHQGYGPGEVLNPFEIWLMVIVVASIAFFGHFALRIWGVGRGPLLLGLFGGLASSTAVTVGSARLAASVPSASHSLAAGIAMGTSVMYLRTMALIWILSTSLFMELWLPLLAGGLGVGLGALVFSRKSGLEHVEVEDLQLPPPSDITTALQFGVVLALVLLASYYAKSYIGVSGVFGVSALSGLVDVDAVTITMSQFSKVEGDVSIPSLAMLLAIGVNSLSKVGISIWLAGVRLGKLVAISLATGFTTMFVAYLLF